jgi:hypothetical protein
LAPLGRSAASVLKVPVVIDLYGTVGFATFFGHLISRSTSS